MNIISFDIGIKNLSYCVICKETCSILSWGILNISCDELCEHSTSKKKCDKSATRTNNNINLCTSHSKLKKYSDSKFKNIKSNNSIFNIGKKLINKLDQIINIDYDEVLIENQPSLKNPTMKSIQMIVYTYFLINSNVKVEMVNARNKLKAYKGPVILTPYEDIKKNKYKNNKYLAIQYCSSMIKNEQNKFIDLFNSSKKKDDLADAYLQGMYWLKK